MLPVEREHDGGQEGEVGDGQDEPHGQLGVVGLCRHPVRAGRAPPASLTGAGGEQGEAGTDRTDDLPALAVRAAASRALAGPDGDHGSHRLAGAEAESALACHAAVREEAEVPGALGRVENQQSLVVHLPVDPTPGHTHQSAALPTHVLTAVVPGEVPVAPGQTAHHVPDLVRRPEGEDGQLDVESPPDVRLVDGEGERVRAVGPEMDHLLVPHTPREGPGAAQPPLAPPSETVSSAAVRQEGLACAGLEEDLEGPLVGLTAQLLRLDRVDEHRALRELLVPAAHQVDTHGEGEGAGGEVGQPHEALRVRHGVQGEAALV